MSNRLVHEKSPYLLQHAENPVDWYPWGEEAFARARETDKPIFLSVGYSTCHWCHVMERESFERPAVAEVMNELFVNIKVDREERPDVDRLYMTYVQAVTGSGGWPMSVFLTAELKPFYGGTYFPPVGGYGRPGFSDLLHALSKAWITDRPNVIATGESSLGGLQNFANAGLGQSADGADENDWRAIYDACYAQLAQSYDAEWGGFGGPPKFPRPVTHDFLHGMVALTGNETARQMSGFTLRQMAERGMNDQLGGGFHRYSVDGEWIVSHFEKMLYDQAQLTISYLEMYQMTGEVHWAQVAEATLKYVWHDMTHIEGAFFAAEDADSLAHSSADHKEEGAFYVWTRAEVERLLGQPDATLFNDFYGVEAGGNAPAEGDPHGEFRGKNILFEANSLAQVARQNGVTLRDATDKLAAAREKLLAARSLRPRPHRDEKIIVAWNGLMISAFARAGAVLDNHRFVRVAANAAGWIWRELWHGQGLRRHWKDGATEVAGFLDDYAAFARALLDLYETDFEVHWLTRAHEVLEAMHRQFWDEAGGGYFNSRPDERILVRFKEDYDGAEPSGNSLAAWAWAKLYHLTGSPEARERAERTCQAFAGRLGAIPSGMPLLLRAHMMLALPPQHLVICGDSRAEDTRALLRVARESFLPFLNTMVLGAGSLDVLAKYQTFLTAMTPVGDRATAYLCQDFNCARPVTEPGELRQLLANVVKL